MKQVNFTNNNNNVLFDTVRSLLLYYYPTECYPWDDFLDFSRMSLPKNGNNNRPRHMLFQVWRKRLVINMFQRFRGNYIWLCIWILLIMGAATEKRILIGFWLTACSWFIICFVLTCYGSMKHRRKSIGSLSLPKIYKQCDEEPNHLFLVSI
jgi:hypothetical protein